MTGCGTMRSGRAWGDDAIYPIARKSIHLAARNALLDPITWLPLVGAGVIAAGDWDQDISDWATEHTPLFGSESGARTYSDISRAFLQAEAFATTLMTPSGEDPAQWALAKGKGALVGITALGVTTRITSDLKGMIGRERPDHLDNRSMPSGHASSAFGAMQLANRNLDYIDMSRSGRTGLQAANVALAASVAWARLEGERHFPTDVMVGAALGNFTTRLIYETLIGTTPNDKFSVYVEPSLSGGKVFLAWQF